MEPVTLQTGRLLLRPFDERDVDAVYAACQDEAIRRWIPVPDPYRRKDAEEFVAASGAQAWRDNTMYNFGTFTADGTLVSSIGLVRLACLYTPDRQAEIGFWTAPGQRGRGYTVEAARAVIDWGFRVLGVERLEWFAEVGNTGSRAVAARLGFVMEGVQRARIVHRGTRRDAYAGALLPSDLGHDMPTPHLPAPS